MKKTTKALVYSTFIFPGAGQWFLKRYKSAIALLGIAIIATSYIVIKAVSIAWGLKDQIIQGHVAPDIFALRQAVMLELEKANPATLNWAVGIIALAWLLSIVDIYWLNRMHR